MKKIYFILLFYAMMSDLNAQQTFTLNWKIVDENLNPIPWISVVKKGNSGGVDGNRFGEFSISVQANKDTIIILSLGHQALEVPISKDTPKKWIEVLEGKSFTLPEMVISGRYYSVDTTKRCCFCKPIVSEIHCFFPSKEDQQITKESELSISKPSVQIFPIPTNNFVFLSQKSALGTVDLYNLNGQKLQSFNFGEQLNASIDLSAYTVGTYFLRSNLGWVEKVVLQK